MSESVESSYQLLDSGAHQKLERYGSIILARPSSVCIWKQRSPELWRQADATYVPGRDEESGGWKFKGKPFETWDLEYTGCHLTLRLQKNGQIGLFAGSPKGLVVSELLAQEDIMPTSDEMDVGIIGGDLVM